MGEKRESHGAVEYWKESIFNKRKNLANKSSLLLKNVKGEPKPNDSSIFFLFIALWIKIRGTNSIQQTNQQISDFRHSIPAPFNIYAIQCNC